MQKEKSMTKNYKEYNENFKTYLVIKAFQLYMLLTYSCVADMREFKFVWIILDLKWCQAKWGGEN